MISLDDLEDIVLSLPEAEKVKRSVSFRQSTYRVNGKNFIGVEKDGVHAVFALDEVDVQKLVGGNPVIFESIVKANKAIGVRADIGKLSSRELRELIRKSWHVTAVTYGAKTCSRGHKFEKSRELPVCPVCWPGYYRK
jgi:YjbR